MRPPPELWNMIMTARRFAGLNLFRVGEQREPESGEADVTTTPVPVATSAVGAASGKLHAPKRCARCWGVGTTFWAFKVSWAERFCVVIILVACCVSRLMNHVSR